MAASTKPKFHRFTVGDYECISISDGTLDYNDAIHTFQGASSSELKEGLIRHPQISWFTRDGIPFLKDIALNFLLLRKDGVTTLSIPVTETSYKHGITQSARTGATSLKTLQMRASKPRTSTM